MYRVELSQEAQRGIEIFKTRRRRGRTNAGRDGINRGCTQIAPRLLAARKFWRAFPQGGIWLSVDNR